MSSANNIQHFREAKGWSRPELGRRMGTSGQQIERLEKGQRKLTQEWIDKAATALGVSASDIITKLSSEPAPAEEKGLPLSIDKAPDIPRTLNSETGSIGLRKVDFSLSMGDGTNLDDYFEEGMFEIDAAFLRALTKTPAHRLIMGDGIGDSMIPTIHDGSTVIIDTTQTVLTRDDFIWAVAVYGAGGIKRLQKIGRERVLVISDNPIVPNREVEAEDLRILGRVIWSARRH